MRRGFCAAAVVGAVVGLTVVAKQGVVYSRAMQAAALAVFVLGSASFALTRSRAHDAERPLVPLGMGLLSPQQTIGLPQMLGVPHDNPITWAATCPQGEWGPLVRVRKAGIELNGRPIADLEAFRVELVTLKNNYRLLHPDDELALSRSLAIDGDVPTAQVAPILIALTQDGPAKLTYLIVQPEVAETRTLGNIDRPQTCAFPLALDVDGTSVSRFARWSEIVNSVAKGAPLHIAPSGAASRLR
jgi:hypothetical protein